MITVPPPEISVPAAPAPQYLWVLVPAGPAGIPTTPREAYEAKQCAMDQHRDTDAAAVFEVQPADDWPYVRLTPHGGWSRAAHEWMAANVARQGQGSQTESRRTGKSGT